jgi:hypothetical protein
VNLKYEDDQPVEGKGIGRKVIDKLQQTYRAELSNKDFAYDGEKSLFTVGGLPQKNNEFTVVLEDASTGKLVLFFDLLSCCLCLSRIVLCNCDVFFVCVVVGLLPMGALEVMTVLEVVTGRE